ncbi:sodium:proline symporter [Leisingera daeponensis]|uniref:sodium:proline symporter n=1 Tax=Leisingera daeponensis TaxID=405746 RepID=UPI001C97A89D|nr:sodium:proline symporter [Leisingera daeponensis]MBY6054868.1 sodium:proline symporter [Leisingera daeponensis]
MQAFAITALFAAVIALSLIFAPRRVTVGGFFGGEAASGRAPGLWTLVLSQVTTWIFARSLMNAAILGFYYGIAGTLAYAAYYGSFLTGGYIVGRMRAHGAGSVQDWLAQRFGAVGTMAYNLVIALRLLSEVFANLLVVGLIFAAALPQVQGAETIAIVAVGLLALGYSAWGGLSAALRTDVIQMLVFLAVFGTALAALSLRPGFDLAAVLTAPGTAGAHNGWVLLAVAALQVFSYPVHDPVMMDRGFLADPATTRKSFLHAFWISAVCILGFGFFGIQASLEGATYEGQLLGTWAAMLPGWVYVLLIVSLLVSALSTLDSALSSAARLVTEELRLAPRTLAGGRLAMLGFAAAGGALTLWGNQTLFDAVAVSGTASMFLTPVLAAALAGRQVALWAYLASFAAAMAGAAAYMLRDLPAVAALLYEGHKYEQLLQICLVVLLAGFAAVAAGSRRVEAGQAG